MVNVNENVKKKTLLGYELTYYQDACVNYLVPSISAWVLYSLLIASDVATIVSHYRNGDPIWGSLTLFFMYLPALGSFIIIISSWELWPEFEGCGRDNLIWCWIKVVEHLFFPIWSMWRYAERIFWSIEAVRAEDKYSVEEILSILNSPRSIELYVFLQSYVHSLPQVLLQFYILVRHNRNVQRETAYAQLLSIIFNLLKLSVTTTYYQRFRSQKLTGKQYPWYKNYKYYAQNQSPSEEQVVLRRPQIAESRSVVDDKRNTSKLEDSYALEPPIFYTERRRSSDIYLEPSTSEGSKRLTLLETDFDMEIKTKVKHLDGSGTDEPDNIINTSPISPDVYRETSVVDGPQRRLFRETGISERTEPDFNVSRVISVKGLEDDDLAGKLVATVWWFAFLLTRVLAISMSAYFFIRETFYLIFAHYLLSIVILCYDVKSDAVKRSKTLFFIFLCYVYVFCIIEFKIRFKKATSVYYGFFVVVFLENFAMCLTWYIDRVDDLENDFWYRYAFYIVVIGTLLSFSSMVFYLIINKPKKVIVGTKIQSSRI